MKELTTMQTTTFKELALRPELERALNQQGYTKPTPIQAQAIPGLLAGKDLIGIAQTGTGKTAAFTLPILHRMTKQYPQHPKTLILAPTRELAAQIGESFATYGQYLKYKHTVIFGGVGQDKQIRAIKRGVDIIIATPGRLLDLLNQNKLSLADIEFLVLDEADQMLDMGFIRDIKKILAKMPSEKQTLFFSATMSSEVHELAKSMLKEPLRVEITPPSTTVERIKQSVYFVDKQDKDQLLVQLLTNPAIRSTIIFTRTKHKADRVSRFLTNNDIPSAAIHGNKSQGQRVKAISQFKQGKINVLVATDIAARGIDISGVSHVINYELPNEPESYVHRIGRTGRAGADGVAYALCGLEEKSFLRDIEKLIKEPLEVADHTYHSDAIQRAKGSPPKQSRRHGRPRKHNVKRRGTSKPFTRRGTNGGNRGNRFDRGNRSRQGNRSQKRSGSFNRRRR